LLHLLIRQAMLDFQNERRDEHQTRCWEACKEAIKRCPTCATSTQFKDLLKVSSPQDAFRELRLYTREEERLMKITDIYFTHDSINRTFANGQKLEDLADQVYRNPSYIRNVEPPCVMLYHDRWRSVNNRRVWSFREAQRRLNQCGWELWIPVNVRSFASPWTSSNRHFCTSSSMPTAPRPGASP